MRIHVPDVFAAKLIPQKYFYVLATGVCEYSHYIHTEVGGKGANTYFKNSSSRVFTVFARVRIQAPACIRTKINSSRMFSCMYRFCAGVCTQLPKYHKKTCCPRETAGIVSQRGVIAPICLVWYRASIPEIPFFVRVITPPLRMVNAPKNGTFPLPLNGDFFSPTPSAPESTTASQLQSLSESQATLKGISATKRQSGHFHRKNLICIAWENLTGAHKRGLKPQILRSFLGNRAFSEQIGALSRPIGGSLGVIGTSAPRNHKGRTEIAPKKLFWPNWRLSGPSPRLLQAGTPASRRRGVHSEVGGPSPTLGGAMRFCEHFRERVCGSNFAVRVLC